MIITEGVEEYEGSIFMEHEVDDKGDVDTTLLDRFKLF